MTELRFNSTDGPKLKKALALKGVTLAVDLPEELTTTLGIKSEHILDRNQWREWLSKFAKSKALLIWIGGRCDDDQQFFEALAAHLPVDASLWSFHAMGALLTDRMTGDAVQLLLVSAGLLDKECVNIGHGYYARRFVRARGSKPRSTAKVEQEEAAPDPSADVTRRDTIRMQKVREALLYSQASATSASMHSALEEAGKPRKTTRVVKPAKVTTKRVAKATAKHPTSKKTALAKKTASISKKPATAEVKQTGRATSKAKRKR